MYKFSITTATYNSAETLEETLQSVLSQTYPDVEHIIVDGGSTDRTLAIIDKHRSRIAKVISEPDEGIYDAINKGLRLATGEIVGNLNSDDLYANIDVLKKVATVMEETGADVVWGDLVYVDRVNTAKVVRYWKSSEYSDKKFRSGWMPPHPTFFVRRSVYEKYGVFHPDFKISADYELMLRFLEKYKLKSCYIPEILVKMRTGGKTRKSILNIINILKYKQEDYRAWKVNGLEASPFAILFLKSFSKLRQYYEH